MSEHIVTFRLRSIFDHAITTNNPPKPLTSIFEIVWPAEKPVQIGRRYLRSTMHPANYTRVGII